MACEALERARRRRERVAAPAAHGAGRCEATAEVVSAAESAERHRRGSATEPCASTRGVRRVTLAFAVHNVGPLCHVPSVPHNVFTTFNHSHLLAFPPNQKANGNPRPAGRTLAIWTTPGVRLLNLGFVCCVACASRVVVTHKRSVKRKLESGTYPSPTLSLVLGVLPPPPRRL
eukprot:1406631-Prymnesium_polylepis.6